MKTASAKCCPSCGERYDADVLFCPRDGTPLVSSRSATAAGAVAERDPYVGAELAGQIKIRSLIGIGSMGRVYRAFQGGIDRDVAVKILHRELSGNAELVGRFHREARVASRLVHANVVQVLMTGNLPQHADARIGGELYLVMEHLDGISLLSALAAASGESGAALPLPRALHVALQICDAVGEAHAQGIIHRDLKPENVMLVRRGEDPDYVKVLDFGIARLTWIDRSMATQAGLIFGTAKYISPEGAEGQAVGPAADVYSIATMLYQCLAGRTPFEGDSHVTLLMHHAHTTPPPLTRVPRASYVPAPIASVIMQNLAKKPGDRAADARALGRDLIAAARASGLFPEDIVPQSALLISARPGEVKLASKERTKAHELSVDLASKIGGVPSRGPEAPKEAEPSAKPEPPPKLEPPAKLEPAAKPEPPAPEGAAAKPTNEPKRDVDPIPNEAPTAAPPQQPTIQGTETSLVDDEPARPRRARPTARLSAIVACCAIAALLVVAGVRRLRESAAAAQRDTIEAQLDDARDCIRRHAWDDPADPNVKAITDRALDRWPGDARVRDLRREAAERIVTDALGRKYAGDIDGALRLTKLALDLSPALTTAQHLAAELTASRSVQAPPTSASARAPNASEKAPSVTPKPSPNKNRSGASGAEGASLNARSDDTDPADRPAPPPPALPSTQAPPASTGPWL